MFHNRIWCKVLTPVWPTQCGTSCQSKNPTKLLLEEENQKRHFWKPPTPPNRLSKLWKSTKSTKTARRPSGTWAPRPASMIIALCLETLVVFGCFLLPPFTPGPAWPSNFCRKMGNEKTFSANVPRFPRGHSSSIPQRTLHKGPNQNQNRESSNWGYDDCQWVIWLQKPPSSRPIHSPSPSCCNIENWISF